MYNQGVDIEFDPNKAKSNKVKHRVSFEEASTSLFDPLALVRDDPDSDGESRWVLVGMSAQARLLTVVYTLRNQDHIRLISARKATKNEAKNYARRI